MCCLLGSCTVRIDIGFSKNGNNGDRETIEISSSYLESLFLNFCLSSWILGFAVRRHIMICFSVTGPFLFESIGS